MLDANVLYPARLRDLLVRLAIAGLYQARWSAQILDECFDNLLENRPDLTEEQLARTRQLMSTALPDAVVTGYEDRVEEFGLPDVDDRHVLAAAVAAGASLLVTDNLDDFPAEQIPEGMRVVSPDPSVGRAPSHSTKRSESSSMASMTSSSSSIRSVSSSIPPRSHNALAVGCGGVRSWTRGTVENERLGIDPDDRRRDR